MEHNLFGTFLLCLLLVQTLSAQHNGYCSSTCIDYTGACFDDTPQGCWACADSIYNIQANLSSTTPCSLADQTTIVAQQLENSPLMDLTGYASSTLTPLTCTNYTFSGQYVSTDFLAKNFSGISLNHYALVIRFNVGYMGFWDTTDILRLQLQDQSQLTSYDYNYSCEVSENICDEAYNTTDCIRIRQYTMVHNTSYLSLNFTSLTSGTNATEMSWGVKELTIAAKMCHAFCQRCFDGTHTGCLSCASGYFLQGNVCLKKCENGLYQVSGINQCVTVCPTYYYPGVDGKGTKVCESCQVGCMMCSGTSTCQAWENQEAYRGESSTSKLEFWILLAFVLAVIVFFIICLIVRNLMKKPNELEEKLNGKSKEGSGQTDTENNSKKNQQEDKNEVSKARLTSEANLNITNEVMQDTIEIKPESQPWFSELLQLQPSEVKVGKKHRKRKFRQEDIADEVGHFDL